MYGFVENRGRGDAEKYFRRIRAHRSDLVAEKALMDENFHVNRGVRWFSADFADRVSFKERCVYKAVFGRTLRELLWDKARDRVIEREERLGLAEYHSDW